MDDPGTGARPYDERMMTSSEASGPRLSHRFLGNRPWLRAALISLVCLLLGAVFFLVIFGVELEQRGDSVPPALFLFLFLDVLVGVTASIAAGPVRGSRVGNLILVGAAVVSTWAFPAGIVAAVRLGSRRSLALDSSVITITALGAGGYAWIREFLAPGIPASGIEYLLFMVVGAGGAGLALLWGRVRATRTALVIALSEQAASAEAAHQAVLQVRQAEIARTRVEERSAIARDMHDGISHQLAIVAMHSGALAHREDLTADQRQSAASTVRDAAADASSMLRDALTALRGLGDAHPTSPLPDAHFIQRLMETARDDGHPVEFTWVNMTAQDLDQTAGRTATLGHILRELLLNARKHAPGARVSVQIADTAGTTVLRVSNPLVRDPQGPVGTGLGLLGVAERAELLGGAATYGRSDDGTFDVEVVLP